MAEPCPFCGARIIPLMIGSFKKCPLCNRAWYESGGSWARSKYGGGGGGEGGAAAAAL